MVIKQFFIGALIVVLSAQKVCADVADPLDPFDLSRPESASPDIDADEKKSAPELIQEAAILLMDERPLDARSKLLIALKKDPKAYRAHMMLGSYYLVHVGHFRLAMQYIKQAENVFMEVNGAPPYKDYKEQMEHSQILYLLSQARLNLDNYQGALDTLDRYKELGYFDDWYAGSRAWILMKLGRIPEAIKVAQLGYAASSSDSDKGQILNMLGILYSMNRQRPMSIDIFKSAIAQELSRGSQGQPATPLNNVGEVYNEIFEEDKAENAWLRATSMPDGCEHVLPSLNLALLYISELKLKDAKKAIDNFESCVAQYPLRNGEEHKALVNLARGRIDLHSGRIESALAHLKNALEKKQWFGKIGTSERDLEAAANFSMAQALKRKNNQLKLTPSHSLIDYVKKRYEIIEGATQSWWYMRRARQILTEDLSNFEDLYVRNTDSMLEYPTLGELAAGLPEKKLKERIESLRGDEERKGSSLYYKAYLAESALAHGESEVGNELLDQIILEARRKNDDLLKLHVIALKLKELDPTSPSYTSLAYAAFALNRASLRNYGLRLPVSAEKLSEAMQTELKNTPFLITSNAESLYSIRETRDAGETFLEFVSRSSAVGNIKVKGSDITEISSKLVQAVFEQDL